MLNPKFIKKFKRHCIHESGHAVLAFKFDAVIDFIEIKIQFEKSGIFTDGVCKHDMSKFIEDLNDGSFKFKSSRVFAEYLIIMWGGMVAESICYPETKCTIGAKYDLEKINGMANLVPESYDPIAIVKAARLLAQDYIIENRKALEKLANKLFYSLLLNNFSIKIEGPKIIEILSGKGGERNEDQGSGRGKKN